MSSEKFIAVALVSLAGPLIWVVHFAVVYGAQHFLCSLLGNGADFWIEASIIAIIIAALSVLAFFGVLWSGTALFFLPTCASVA